ncbi:MAG: metal-dependent hydrolase [Desulfovibrionaceae bacterium]
MNITWFGHSNFQLAHNGITVVIDPFFHGNPNAPITCGEVECADLVLVTHDHGDHVGQAVDLAKATGAKLVGVFDTVNKLVGQGLPQKQAVGMNLGGGVELAGVRIHMVQAMHSTASGAPAGYILTFPGGPCVYHSGDTALFASMALFAEFHDIDVALLPIDGYFNMDGEQAAYACKLLRCKAAVPMHWGTFPMLAQDTTAFEAGLKKHAPATRMLRMLPGDTVKL